MNFFLVKSLLFLFPGAALGIISDYFRMRAILCRSSKAQNLEELSFWFADVMDVHISQNMKGFLDEYKVFLKYTSKRKIHGSPVHPSLSKVSLKHWRSFKMFARTFFDHVIVRERFPEHKLQLGPGKELKLPVYFLLSEEFFDLLKATLRHCLSLIKVLERWSSSDGLDPIISQCNSVQEMFESLAQCMARWEVRKDVAEILATANVADVMEQRRIRPDRIAQESPENAEQPSTSKAPPSFEAHSPLRSELADILRKMCYFYPDGIVWKQVGIKRKKNRTFYKAVERMYQLRKTFPFSIEDAEIGAPEDSAFSLCEQGKTTYFYRSHRKQKFEDKRRRKLCSVIKNTNEETVYLYTFRGKLPKALQSDPKSPNTVKRASVSGKTPISPPSPTIATPEDTESTAF